MKRYISTITAMLVALAFTGSAAAIDLDDFGGVEIHGFISQGYLKSDDNNFFAETSDGTSQFNEMGINFSTEVTDQLRMGVQLFARNLGDFGGGDIEVDWAFADYRFRDEFGLRAGKMKLAYGLYNETRDVDFLRTGVFLPTSIYNEAWRDSFASIQGAGAYGTLEAGAAGSFDYQFLAGLSDIDTDGGIATSLSDQLRLTGGDFNTYDTNSNHTYSGVIFWNSPVEGLRFGGTIAEMDFEITGAGSVPNPMDPSTSIPFDNAVISCNSKAYVASIEYSWENLTIASEYALIKYDMDFTIPGRSSTENDFDSEGYYLSASYRFTDWFELGAYYSEYYPDKDDKDGDDYVKKDMAGFGVHDYDAWLKDACLSTRFDINEYWIIKLEGHIMDGAATLMKDQNMVDGKLATEEDWYLLAAKMTFNF